MGKGWVVDQLAALPSCQFSLRYCRHNFSTHIKYILCGRRVSAEEIEQIKETVELFPRLSLKELVATIYEHLGWYTAADSLKREACMKFLRKLEAAGIVKLAEKQKVGGIQEHSKQMVYSPRTDPLVEITGTVKELRRVSLEAVQEKQEKELWNEYVFRYHGLGYKLRLLGNTDLPRGRSPHRSESPGGETVGLKGGRLLE